MSSSAASAAIPARPGGPPTRSAPAAFEFFRHHGVWAPGVRLFRRCAFPTKALIVSAMFLMPILLLATSQWRSSRAVIALATSERAGVAVMRALLPVPQTTDRAPLAPTRAEWLALMGTLRERSGLALDPDRASSHLVDELFLALPPAGAQALPANSPNDQIERLDQLDALDRLLAARIIATRQALLWSVALVAAGLLLAGYLFHSFRLVAQGGLDEIRRHLAAMTAGDLTTQPNPRGKDEAAALMGALREMQAALRMILTRSTLATDSGGIGIWEWDIADASMRWDRWMYRLYGRQLGDEVSCLAQALTHLHPDDRAPTERALRDAVEIGTPFDSEFRVVWRDGSVRHIRGTGQVIRAADGRAPRMVGANWDITDLRRATEAAERANQAQAELIATISHELRTPLQSVIGFSELGREFAAGHPDYRQIFVDIHTGGHRMLRLVNALLDLSKNDDTVGSIELRRDDLAALAAEVVDELAPLAAERGVRFALPDPLPCLPADVDGFRIQQVIRNVLANGLRFAPSGSVIEVDCEAPAGVGVALCVRDHGPGIPAAELDTIFDAFVQSSRTRDGSGGTGLGLTICRKIMATHRGSIVASNAADGGAQFHIRLPAIGGEAAHVPLTLN
jgi:signal transduction histidine kinase/HAMP domain-containing protein